MRFITKLSLTNVYLHRLKIRIPSDWQTKLKYKLLKTCFLTHFQYGNSSFKGYKCQSIQERTLIVTFSGAVMRIILLTYIEAVCQSWQKSRL
jgi:hypothetical protein